MVGVLTYVGLAVFGALGAVARHRVDAALSGRLAATFPFGILTVNLTGTLALGLLVGAGASSPAILMLGTGFLGGYTTFSTWMVDSERLGESGHTALAVANLAGSMLLGLAAAALGYYVGQAIA